MIYAGIDYSMISPAICIFDDANSGFSFNNTTIHYMTDRKKYLDLEIPNLKSTESIVDYTSSMDRFSRIKDWAMKILEPVDYITIEDYSMGSKGKTFNIAENTGILKYALFLTGKNFVTIPPTVLKKFATGKGNADKQKMYDAFIQETGLDIRLSVDEKLSSPVSDIVDSYFFCKYCVTNSLLLK